MGIKQLTSWLRGTSTPRKNKQDSRTRLQPEYLEDRTAPAIFTVNWDGSPARGAEPVFGGMTLQQAITASDSLGGTNQINFGNILGAPAGTPVQQVYSFSTASVIGGVTQNNGPFPAITTTVTIDGSVLNEAGTYITTFLESSAAGDNVNGFTVKDGTGTKTGANTIIKNMIIEDPGAPGDFSAPANGEFGVKITTAGGGVSLQNLVIQGIDGDGVEVVNSPNNIIGGAGTGQGMLITANNGNGVRITGAASTGNIIQTDIGVTVAGFGTSAISANGGSGILFDTSAGTNIIGGFTSSPVNTGNMIIQNTLDGIDLNNSSNNRIQRNLVGLDNNGNPKANSGQGLLIENGSSTNLIGGNDVPNATIVAGNTFAGNTGNGIEVTGATSSANQIQGNLIGIFKSNGAYAGMPNTGNGILVSGAPGTLIGNTTTAANFIDDNNLNGISITGTGASGAVIVNNRLGINSSSGNLATNMLDTKLGNIQDGILVSGSTNVTIGGGGTNAQNIIGDNRNGINIQSSTNVTLQGNQLGINLISTNTYPNLGNLQDGILIQGSSTIQVGGTQSLQGNKSSQNGNGVHIISSTGVTLQGNIIGPNLTGTGAPDPQPVGQAVDGILVESSSNITIGSAIQNGGNLISLNRHGINIRLGSSNVLVQNNRIGTQTNTASTPDLGNGDDGVVVDASSFVTIGGTAGLTSNTIAKNADGIQISTGSTNVLVEGNLIRNNAQSGIHIIASSNNTIGGDTTAAKNVIENRHAALDTVFQLDGIFIEQASKNNLIEGNYIGTDSTGATTVGNHGNGIYILGSSNNTIGGDAGTPGGTPSDAGIGNIIADNSFDGVAVVESTAGAGDADGNEIWGNSIFGNGLLGIELGGTSGTVNTDDNKDVDNGANHTQNYPVITFAESGSAFGTHITGTFNSTPNHTFRLEFYGDASPNTTGSLPNYGQGTTYLGFMIVTTDANGNAVSTPAGTGNDVLSGIFDFYSPNIVQTAATYVTATATDITPSSVNLGDTSEFALDKVVTGNAGPATYVVNNDDGWWKTVATPNPDFLFDGEGTTDLKTAITLANQHPGTDRIVFSMSPIYTVTSNGATKWFQDVRTVFTNGNLPDITDSVIIDGSPLAWPVAGGDHNTATNYTALFNAGAGHGFQITDLPTAQSTFANPNGNPNAVVMRHLSVNGTTGVGITIEPNQDYSATAATGKHTALYGNANIQDVTIGGWSSDGVDIINSPGNDVGGSGSTQSVSIQQISGNGVLITGALSTGNLVQQTKIGTTFGAGGNGIWISGANNNTIGGFTTNTGDNIQASGGNGIYILNSSGTVVQRSTIGDPTDIFENKENGIQIENSPLTLIGGVNSTAGNTIVGNTQNGIYILGTSSQGAMIQSNQIGTTTAPNSQDGIFVSNVAGVLIGSTITATNNIDGNNRYGIEIYGSGSSGARIVNTNVGAGGGNVLDGIYVHGANTTDVVNNVGIGGSGNSAGGTIAGNQYGINLLNATNVTIQQYTIKNNSLDGIVINSLTPVGTPTSSGILIGGTASAAAGNTIENNQNGVHAINSSFVTLEGNTIENQSQDGVVIDSTGSVAVGEPFPNGGNSIGGNRNGVTVFDGSSGFSIQNNIIGSAGFGVGANSDDGILLEGITGATVGGTASLSPNFVSGNQNGLELAQGSGHETIYQNEFANSTQNGILLDGSSNNTIGGTVAFGVAGGQGNVISSNGQNGINISPDYTNPLNLIFSNNNLIQGNYIGVNQKGTGSFGNTNSGVYIESGNNNTIGGTATGQGNVIANSGASGVVIVADNGPAAGNSIEANTIFNNGGLGIELGSNVGSVTLNDSRGHASTSPNRYQNFPVLLSAQTISLVTTITGTLNSTANHTFRIDFFSDTQPNANGTPPGYGQGSTYIGFTTVTTNASGAGAYTFTPVSSVATGSWISATATDLTTGDTSEFAKDIQVVVGVNGPETFTVTNDDGYWRTIAPANGFLKDGEGPLDLSEAITLANEHPGTDKIVFSMSPIYTFTTKGATKWFSDVRSVFTNGNLPDITDSVILDGSYLAAPLAGGDHATAANYTALFNNFASRGFEISDVPTSNSLSANPNATPNAVVLRHVNSVADGASGIGVEINANQQYGTGTGKHTALYGNSNLQDMVISGWDNDGVRITNSPGNIVGGSGATQSVSIQNVGGSGVDILGTLSTNNLVQQTFIGTQFGPGGNGIWIQQNANNNTIGGFTANTGDTIKDAAANGIYILNSSGTTVQRSTIGDPTDFFENKENGIQVENSPNTLIGGLNATAGNTIVGNTQNGILAIGVLSTNLMIQSDQIGTTSAPNSLDGIFVNNVPGVLIGSTTTATNNIDGNNRYGIEIYGSGASGTRVVNTNVGTGGGNVLDGIYVHGATATDVVNNIGIGTPSTNGGGTITGNQYGINLLNATNVNIQQYTIKNNSLDGIVINSLTPAGTPTSSGIVIGGTTAGQSGNTITGNLDGVHAINSSNVTLEGNTIENQSEDGVVIDSTGTVAVGEPFQNGGNTIGGNRNGVTVINGSAGFSIQNNVIGVGTGSTANTDDGILLEGITGATIGGTSSLSPNIVSGDRYGLQLEQGSGSATIYQNQFTNSVNSGIQLLGSSNNIIGGQVGYGQVGGQGNVISSNGSNGIDVTADNTNPLTPIYSNNNSILGNFIGVKADGATAAGNAGVGVRIDSGNNNVIGGTVHSTVPKLNQGNVIANSGQSGVVIVTDYGPAVGDAILGNSIYNSGLLGIELGSNVGNVTLNDSQGHAATSPNRYQNFPVVTSAETGSLVSLAAGYLNANPNTQYRIEVFGNPSANPTGNPVGYGQGQTYIGFQTVTTDGTGHATFSFSSQTPIAAGSWVSATATNLTTGDTSEFGLSVQAVAAVGVISGEKFNDLNGDGIKQAAEPGLQGWEIDLYYNGDTNVDAKATTDANGNYSFTGLTDGTYKLTEVQKNGWVQTASPIPDPMQISGQPGSELPLSNENFGNFQLVQISGNKFEDLKGDGKDDPGDPPLSGVTIDLYQVSKVGATLIGTTVTDLSGNYTFTNLGPLTTPVTGLGPITLRVREVSPTGFTQTTANPNDFTLVSGNNVTGLNFGNHPNGGGGGGGDTPGDSIIVVGTDAGVEGTVRVLNATTQATLFTFDPFPGFTGGIRVATGDINGDGIPDIICAAGPGGGPAVKVYDGSTGQVIRSFFAYSANFTGGVYVAASDVNKGGYDSIITGAGAGGGPHVEVFDGKSNIELFSFFAYASTFTGGVTVAGGDVNDDGYGDIITGAGPSGGPEVRVFSGATFGQPINPTLLQDYFAYTSTFTGGIFVASGHFDNDNHQDIVVGPGKGGGPEVKVFSGATQGVLEDFLAFGTGAGTKPPSLFTGDSLYFTGVRVGTADLNGDGISDILVGPGGPQSSHVIGYSGTNLAVLANLNPVFDPSFLGGIFVG